MPEDLKWKVLQEDKLHKESEILDEDTARNNENEPEEQMAFSNEWDFMLTLKNIIFCIKSRTS